MEFFDWISVPQVVLSFLDIFANSAEDAVSKSTMIMIICLASAAGLYLIGLLFGGFGLMTMARRKGMKNWWLGFVPFGNTYLAGQLAGDTSVFGAKMKRSGLYAMLAEIVYVGLEVALLVISFLLLNADFYEFVTVGDAGDGYWQFSNALFMAKSPEFAWILTLNTVLEVIAYLSRFVALFFFFVMFTAFFRKYFIRSPFLMAFLCSFLPVRGFVLFAVRNNTPVDYNAYMRRRMEEMQRSSRQQQYGDGGQGNYGGSAGDSPFSDFGGSPNQNGTSSGGGSDDSPFSDF